MHVSKPQIDQAHVVEGATKERRAQNGGVRVAPRNVSDGGIALDLGDTANVECALDALMGEDPLRGALAGDQGCKADRVAVARSRKTAGLRLRSLFIDAGLVPVQAQTYQPRHGGGSDGEAMTDAQDRARSAYNRIIRAMGPWGEIAAGPCCYDLVPDNDRWRSNVRRALDKLCEVQGS